MTLLTKMKRTTPKAPQELANTYLWVPRVHAELGPEVVEIREVEHKVGKGSLSI